MFEYNERNGCYEYERSPRRIIETPDNAIEIKRPPAKKKISKSSKIQMIVTPLVMLIVTIAIGVLTGRGLYIYISLAGMGMTFIFSLVRLFSEIKECKKQNQARICVYDEYLLSMRKKLHQMHKTEYVANKINYLSCADILSAVDSYSERIYERKLGDDDFLNVSLGRMNERSKCFPKFQYDELSLEKDSLEQEALDIRNEYRVVDNYPLTVSLFHGNLGIIGESKYTRNLLKTILLQIVFYHSYHDVNLFCLFNEENCSEYDWINYLPHSYANMCTCASVASNDIVSSQMLFSIQQILLDRKKSIENSNKASQFYPHIVLVVENRKLIEEHSILEFIESNDCLGLSIIYLAEKYQQLPDYIKTIVKADDYSSATQIVNDTIAVNKKTLVEDLSCTSLEWFARNLSTLDHKNGMKLSLPTELTYYEMYGIENPSELNVLERWKSNDAHKSLAVPIGIRITGDMMMLNLHEKAHGPHGLISGTTGSGKSEIIQTIILSLAVNFHPYEVGFLLIDYKGGGMSNLFSKLPHLLGTITNLDAGEAKRSLVSIKSELARRQELFAKCGVNHINGYSELFKLGHVSEALPHLFIISDEFAELKKEQPEFMNELVSIARLGRSLGIHLILATQKPSGVVTDQIWSNSKFKIALKVQDENDSKEIIKTRDAAYIVEPGRAYIQVGNNELYELFQSAYSGADVSYISADDTIDTRVYKYNIFGQLELLNDDLSISSYENKSGVTQLDAIVEYIASEYKKLDIAQVKRPWLPQLDDCIINPQIQNYQHHDLAKAAGYCLATEIGLIDIPEMQTQEEYIHDFLEGGNFVVFGASGYGKSSMLMNVALTLAIKNSPENLNYYIVDFGNSALLPLRYLPHTADYMSFDDGVKVEKLLSMLGDEIAMRKRQFAASGTTSFEMYNRNCEEPMPAVLIFVDNFDIHAEVNSNIEVLLTQIARDGSNVGVFVVVSANRPSVIRYALLNCFKNRIALFLYDKIDYSGIIGKTSLELHEICGRGFVKTDAVRLLQAYVPIGGKSEDDVLAKQRDFVNTMSSMYSGRRPEKIRIMPSELDANNFLTEYSCEAKNEIPIGLYEDDISVATINLNKGRHLVVGGAKSGRTTLLQNIVRLRNDSIECYLVDNQAEDLYELRNEINCKLVSSEDDLNELLETLRCTIEDRQNAYYDAKQQGNVKSKRAYFESLSPIIIVVAEWEEFTSQLSKTEVLNYEDIIRNCEEVNIVLIVSAMSTRMRGVDALSRYMKECVYGIVTGNFSNQSIFNNVGARVIPDNQMGVAYIMDNQTAKKIKMVK